MPFVHDGKYIGYVNIKIKDLMSICDKIIAEERQKQDNYHKAYLKWMNRSIFRIFDPAPLNPHRGDLSDRYSLACSLRANYYLYNKEKTYLKHNWDTYVPIDTSSARILGIKEKPYLPDFRNDDNEPY